MNLNLKVWIGGLISAFSGGLVAGFTTMVVAPAEFNFTTGLKKVIIVAAVMAIVSVLNFLKQSPLPNVPTGG